MKRSLRSGVFFSMSNMKIDEYKREIKRKEKIQTNTQSNIIVIQSPLEKEENIKMHPVAWWNIFSHHHNHRYMSPEGNKVIDMCCAMLTTFLFFYDLKDNITHKTKQLFVIKLSWNDKLAIANMLCEFAFQGW